MVSPRSPVIPEIVRAFENDPRTRLANTAITTGSSTAPVAQGRYAWADGLARTLQGALGGYVQNRQLRRYEEDEQALLALRQQRGEYGLDGGARSGAATEGLPSQAAAALGSPPPQAPQTPPADPQGGFLAAMAPFMQGRPQAPQSAATAAPMVAPNPVPQMLVAPGPAPIERAPVPPSTAGRPPPVQAPAVAFVHPLAGAGRITSPYGTPRAGRNPHNGVDIAVREGTPIGAAADGEVIRAWNDTRNGGGNSVLVRHADGSVTGYAHLAAYNVERGDVVRAGQPIGQVGSTGRSTGPHAHLTYRTPDGRRADPRVLLGAPATAAQSEVPLNATPAAPAPAVIPQITTPAPEVQPLPTAPNAEPATQSPRLGMAYRMMADGNRYESASAMDMMNTGLGEQGDYNEAAAGRRQGITNAGYEAGLNRYGTSVANRDQAAYDARRDERQQGYAVESREDEQQYGYDINLREHAQALERAGYDHRNALELARFDAAEQRRNTDAVIAGRQQTEQERQAGRRENFFLTGPGQRLQTDVQNTIQANSTLIGQLDRFSTIMQRNAPQGGLLLGNAPEWYRWSNADDQELESLTQSMSIALSGALKGAISDREGERILASLPSMRTYSEANRNMIELARGAARRGNEMAVLRLESTANGTVPEFTRDWAAFTEAVPATNPISFEEWRASRRSYDANGRPVTGGQR